MKQSSIEWFFEQLEFNESVSRYELFEQAKEMHEQEITDAWNNGFREFYDGSSTPEEYYNTKFIVKP